MANVAHYIMMHYAEEESIKKKWKKKYKPKAGQYGLEAGLKYFGERGETAVSKELKQFNVYDVFKPLYADKLSNEEKSKALTSSWFSLEKSEMAMTRQDNAQMAVSRGNMWQKRKQWRQLLPLSLYLWPQPLSRGKMRSCNNWHTRSFPPCRKRQLCDHENEWFASWTHGKNLPKH